MALCPGDRFDRYTIEAVLGRGGMGVVYRAHDEWLRRAVALKVLTESDDEGSRGAASANAGSDPERVLREGRAAAAINHPNAVAIFDVGAAAGVPYIAMELVEGARLRAFIPAYGAPRAEVALEERVRWLVDIARALRAAHERDVVHRDVKPENVMIRPDGVVKVLDFGIARAPSVVPAPGPDQAGVAGVGDVGAASTNDREWLAAVARETTIVGSPPYMAPEQIRGEPLDARADQFAWGVVAYELLTGTLPWADAPGGLGEPTAATEPVDIAAGASVVERVLSRHPEPPSRRNPLIAGPIERVVMRALSKPRSERFSAMADVIEALLPFATSAPGAPAAPTLDGSGSVTTEGASTTLGPSLARVHLAGPLALPQSGRRRTLAVAATLLALLVGGAALLRQRALVVKSTARARVSDTGTSASTEVSPRAVDAAMAAYLAGVRAFGDASVMSALASFRRSIELDPTLAAAHLRLAVLDSVEGLVSMRKHLQAATRFRTRLPAVDEAVREAIEPYLVTEPSDFPETERRLQSVIERFPRDPEPPLYLAMYRVGRGDTDVAALLDRAAAIDPRLAVVWWLRGNGARLSGDVEGVARAADACLRVTPSAASCLRLRALAHAVGGKCSSMEADARQMIAVEPEGDASYEQLAAALAAEGAPDKVEELREAVLSALEQAWARDGDDRPVRELLDRLALDQLTGDFASATQRGEELLRRVATSTSMWDHDEVLHWHLGTLAETGRVGEAGRVANESLGRRAAWTAQSLLANSELMPDVTPLLIETARRGGALSDPDATTRRSAWLRDAHERIPKRYFGALWLDGFAYVAETRSGAEEALRALPEHLPLPRFRRWTIVDAPVGKVHLLAGHADDAAPILERAAASCYALEDPIEHTRAHWFLGRARELKGDVAGACKAYGVVVARWGAAKPRSVTGELARGRARALGCATR